MATRKKDWHAEFRRLLAPEILRALKDDRAGKIPLKPAQRRAALKMLRFGCRLRKSRRYSKARAALQSADKRRNERKLHAARRRG